MAVKSKKKPEAHTGNEYLENPEVLRDQITRSEEFFLQHKGVVIGVVAAIALIIAGFFGYRYYKNTQNTEAQNQMFQAIYYFENDSLQQAVRGDGSNLGFSDIVKEYPGTDAANLAQFYAGTCYLKMGEYDLALLYLQDFSSDDLLVQSKAYSLIGDVHMEKGEFKEAADEYLKAANHKPTDEFSPVYLMKAALAYEKAGNTDSAVNAYDQVINDYPTSDQVVAARKYRAHIAGAS